MHSIGARLKVWRESRGLKQAEAAAVLGLAGSTYQNYERDVRAPNTEGWEAFARQGINTNWLLTGEGTMLQAQEEPQAAVDVEDDPQRLMMLEVLLKTMEAELNTPLEKEVALRMLEAADAWSDFAQGHPDLARRLKAARTAASFFAAISD